MTTTTTQPTRQRQELTADELAHFMREGYVRLGRVADAQQIEALQQRIDDIMLGKVRYDDMYLQLCRTLELPEGMKGTTRTHQLATLKYRKIMDLEQDDVYRAYMGCDTFRAITRQLIGDKVAIVRAMFMNKAAGAGSHLPWHQDGATWNRHINAWGMSRPPIVTIWTALDPVTRDNGCLRILPRTHHGQFSLTNGDYPTDDELAPLDPARHAVNLEMQLGEVVLLHNWMLHSSDRNHTTDQSRRALSVCYVDGDAIQTSSGLRYPQIFPTFDYPAERANASATY